jgi:hypothetical protein
MKIMLFIKSYALSADRDALNLAYDYHYFWQGETHHHIYRGFMDKIWSRGRVPDADGIWLLNEVASLDPDVHDLVILDAGTMRGWLGAAGYGVWKFPGMIAGDEKAQGKASCGALLKRLI